MNRFLSVCFALVASCLPALAQTGTPVKQSGNVTPGHASCWTTNGIVQDCGTAAVPFLTSLGTVGQGQTLCAWSALSTAAGAQKICLSATDAGGGSIVTQNYGNDTAQPLTIVVNGTTYQFPGGAGGITGPSTSIVDNFACWNNTIGTLLKDCGPTSSSNQIDIFLVIGDSNAVGEGSSASSPTPPSTVLQYCANGSISTATDPTCSAVNAADNANTGSMWPALGIAYGRQIGFVLTGVDATTQASACDLGSGNWQVTSGGSLYANALTAINAGLAAYTTAGYAPTFRGIIMSLGGNDAISINATTCTAGQYSAAYAAMAANWRAATIGGVTYPKMPIYMIQTGTNLTPPDNPGFPAVRSAQQAIAASDGNTLLIYTDLASFAVRGLLNSGQHPTQAGYNLMGTQIGGALIPFITPQIPFLTLNANTAAPPLPSPGISTLLQLTGVDGSIAGMEINAFGGVFSNILFRQAAGTDAAPTHTTSGQAIGTIGMKGYGTTGYVSTNSSAFQCVATQDFSDTAQGSRCNISVTPNSAATPVLALSLLNGNSAVFGPADAAAPTAQTLSVQNVLTGTSNTAGANLTIAGSRGTGTGAGGNIALQVAPAGSTGSAQNTLATEMTMLGNGNIGFGTETNPQSGPTGPTWVFSHNATTGLSVRANSGVVVMGADSGTDAAGFIGITVGIQPVNAFIRLDGTAASPSNLGSGEIVGAALFSGWGAGAIQGGRARILANTTEAWTSTFGIDLEFDTTPAGGSRAQAMLLKAGAIFGTGTNDAGAGTVLLGPQAFGSLPSCTSLLEGAIAEVNNSNTATWGATVAAGGTNKVAAHCNGANWTVMGD